MGMKTSSKCINEEEPNTLMKVEYDLGIVSLIFLEEIRQVGKEEEFLGQCMANLVCRCSIVPVSGYGFPLKERVDPRHFSSNDYHGRLRRFLRSREPPTLQQNTIESHHYDVRPENYPIEFVHGCALFFVIFAELYGSTRQLWNQTTTAATDLAAKYHRESPGEPFLSGLPIGFVVQSILLFFLITKLCS
ncbi:hypothetical protein CRG98_018102 [Punica granatum]|uniref:Uncharacterized protein n=1 Tax=Punica granatum TaxID=22663 RepID=A0A2I0JYV8_PUNGR|nr:hypothetical protein CRG98_018102 [Punica granatum]